MHGGAGDRIPAEGRETTALHGALVAAVSAAEGALDRGAGALDAVQAAVVVLEDAPWFNAGRGSVPTAQEGVEMDAGIMCGSSLRAGGVAVVSSTRNPITAARLVLEDGAHVLLAGGAADDFARRHGAVQEPPEYFLAPRRSGDVPRDLAEPGTVGAVVCDGRGNLAAGTSTGGLARQLPGRVGDSSLVGAGVYAENGSCAVSCSGTGEDIIRTLLAYRIATAVERGSPPRDACERMVGGLLAEVGGSGGAIAVDARGRVGLCFNTTVMHRAWKLGDEPTMVAST